MIRQSLHLFRYLFLVLCLLSTNLWAADGHLLQINGLVKINGLTAKVQSKINKGDKITTGPEASVKVVLSDGSVLDIKPNSEIDISDYIYSASSNEANSSNVSIIRGTLRYISGLIAKADPDKVSFRAGTATIGVRGTYAQITFDGLNIEVDSSVGTMSITFPNRPPYVISTGQRGTANTATSTTEISVTAVPDAVAQVALLIAESPGDNEAIRAAISALSSEDQTLAVAVLINNADALNVDTTTITTTISTISQVNPTAAATVVVLASVLDRENAGSYKDTAKNAAPEQTNNIDDASMQADSIIEVLNEPAVIEVDDASATTVLQEDITEIVLPETVPPAPDPEPTSPILN